MVALISYLINLIISIPYRISLQYRGTTTLSICLEGELLNLNMFIWCGMIHPQVHVSSFPQQRRSR